MFMLVEFKIRKIDSMKITFHLNFNVLSYHDELSFPNDNLTI